LFFALAARLPRGQGNPVVNSHGLKRGIRSGQIRHAQNKRSESRESAPEYIAG